MTYSVVAFDSAHGQFGVAVASCVPLDVVMRVPGEVPGRGAFVTQSFLFDDSRAALRDRLETGASAEEALAAVIDPAFDPDFQLRQYSVVDADGGVGIFTGESASFVAAHRTERFGPFVYAVQGNLLTGEATLENMEAGFVADGCDLPERLVRALETASFDQGGDRRCTPFGHPAQAALVHVPSVGLAIEVDVGDERADPAIGLRTRFEAWRKEHPCATSGELTNTGDDGCRASAPLASSLSPQVAVAMVSLVALLVLRRSRAATRRVP